MAHQLIVHQCLHGYSEGHRLLSTSTKITPRDLRTMLIMSDASGPGAVIEPNGYLTGYPLGESGYYALARTWTASEVERPGCVWTHSLLISFADLASLDTTATLLSHHTHPYKTSWKFDKPIEVETFENEPQIEAINRLTLRRILWSLYMSSDKKIIASSDKDSEIIVLMIWAQQWAALRRHFRFCTLSYSDRSTDSSLFDLQFVPGNNRRIRSKFEDAVDSNKPEVTFGSQNWCKIAEQDLVDGEKGELRRFIREIAKDSFGERSAYVPLCKLFLLSKDTTIARAIDALIADFGTDNPQGSADSNRVFLTKLISKVLPEVSETALTFLLENLELLGRSADLNAIGSAIWRRNPALLLCQETSFLREFAKLQVSSLPRAELLSVSSNNRNYIPSFVKIDPGLLTESSLWRISGPWVQPVLDSLDSTDDKIDNILRAILLADRGDLADHLGRVVGYEKLLDSLDLVLDTGESPSEDQLDLWLYAVKKNDSSCFTRVLTTEGRRNRKILLSIARITDPDYLVDTSDEDPWVTSLRFRKTELDSPDREYLATFLLARAFGYKSQSTADLIVANFDIVHSTAAESRLTESSWSLLSYRLPRPNWFWQEWDRCDRLRIGVAKIFVERRLSAERFCDITSNLKTFSDICQTIYYHLRAADFLFQVKHILRSEKQPSYLPKLKALEDLL